MDQDNEQQLRDDEWQNQSTDPGGLFNPERDQEILSEDNDRPAAPAQYSEDTRMPVDHPNTDTDIDPGGAYLGGPSEEAGYVPEADEDSDNTVGPIDLDHEEPRG